MAVSVLLKVEFGHAQIRVPKNGIPMSKTAWITKSMSVPTLYEIYRKNRIHSICVKDSQVGIYKILIHHNFNYHFFIFCLTLISHVFINLPYILLR